MIVIYTQDKTFLYENADAAKFTIASLYGKTLGREAYHAVNGKRTGTAYRKYGGPLIKVVDPTEAEKIQKKETAAGIPVLSEF